MQLKENKPVDTFDILPEKKNLSYVKYLIR